ncbi:putative nucleic acid-binding protein [Nocardia tenerifensis]|uniref:Putative nucleic acid-binding protein n=1 Tax=Nocardia tenerifensis TaxID=228006 RepID=A0A318K3L5_9NOCA|nr:PIN domain-containing protein [Nocardia tenerifensis]PXX66664.1 putative nucleic acid-binding protein [Nocardia tenerifensis]
MNSERTFVDTNILFYAYDSGSDDPRNEIAREVLADLWDREVGLLSTQVLQEFYSVATRKFKTKLSPAELRRIIALYSEWCIRDTDPLMVLNASFLAEQHTVSWYDALIIEAASRSGAKYLLTEDLQHGRDFCGLEIRNPFLELGDRATV